MKKAKKKHEKIKEKRREKRREEVRGANYAFKLSDGLTPMF